MNKAQYLAEPCGAASIPYWKAKQICVPDGMRIVHQRDYTPEMLESCTDAPYFRLYHGLERLSEPMLPTGVALCGASVEEFAAHINECYGGGVTVEEVQGYRTRAVYDPTLWLALRDYETGHIVATGLAELDREIGEGILEWIQVSASQRGRGLGKYIVQELLWRLRGKARFVTVSGQCNNPTNPEALYRSCGFRGNDVWHVMRRR